MANQYIVMRKLSGRTNSQEAKSKTASSKCHSSDHHHDAVTNFSGNVNKVPKRRAPPPPTCRADRKYEKPVDQKCVTDPETGEALVELIRSDTKLNYQKCTLLAFKMVSFLEENMGDCDGQMTNLLNQLENIGSGKSAGITADELNLVETLECIRMLSVDSQQIGWAISNDESDITYSLEFMRDIIKNCNPEICMRMFAASTEYLDVLLHYFLKEKRISITVALVSILSELCRFIPSVCAFIIDSGMLIPDVINLLKTNLTIPRYVLFAQHLTQLLEHGEKWPVSDYDMISINFLTVLLELVQSNSETGDAIVNLLLAINLHLPYESNNIMNTLETIDPDLTKRFTEHMLVLLNRGVDPLNQTQFPNSVLKMASDLFSDPATVAIFYTNDVKVIVDVIVRNISDLSGGDPVRTEYLSLLHLLLINSSYFEHCHRLAEMKSCLRSIRYHDNTDDSQKDKWIVKEISDQFPQYF